MKKLMILLFALVASSMQAQAAVIQFEINRTWSQGVGTSDIPATNVSLGGAGHFVLDPGFSDAYFDFTFNGPGRFSTNANEVIEGYYFLRSYGEGEFIGPDNFGNNTSTEGWDTILVDNRTAGVWGESHDGFMGFRTNENIYGYIAYTLIRQSGQSILTLLDGAYQSQAGVGIFTPNSVSEVPLPAAVWLFASGLLGLAGFKRRQRKLSQS